jgi:transposase
MRAADPDGVQKISEGVWLVRSQRSGSNYKVRLEDANWSCECRDFRDWTEPCKHIYRVQIELEPADDSAETTQPPLPRKRPYPQNWAAYNRGQTAENRLFEVLLRELVAEVEEVPQVAGHIGRPRFPLGEAIACAILKVYSLRSGRRAFGVHEVAAEHSVISRAPSFMVTARLLNRSDVTPILYRLLSLSASPLAALEIGEAVAPDSTGMQMTSFGGWREEKHGEKRQRCFLTVHAIVGTRTHVIIRAVVGEANSGDSPQFETLLRGALEDGFRPGSVVADKGYLAKANYRLASELGIEAYIPFKKNSRNRSGHRGSPSAWRDAFYMFQARRDEFDRKYHRRSNVESVFSALKRKLGENVRSKNRVAQVNEIICKLIAYNLTVVVHEMFEHGIAPVFDSK